MESRALLNRPHAYFSVEFHMGHEHGDKGGEEDNYVSAIMLGLGGDKFQGHACPQVGPFWPSIIHLKLLGP